jgi:hypothetical protein
VTMYLFGSLWDHWTLAFRIVTPVLFVAFAAAQLHGTRILLKMWQKEKRLLNHEKIGRLDPGASWVGACEAVVLAGNVAILPSGFMMLERPAIEEEHLVRCNLP